MVLPALLGYCGEFYSVTGIWAVSYHDSFCLVPHLTYEVDRDYVEISSETFCVLSFAHFWIVKRPHVGTGLLL